MPYGYKIITSTELSSETEKDLYTSITKGTEVILPVKPKAYKDWKFLYWVDKDGFIVLKEKRVKIHSFLVCSIFFI